MAQLQKVEGQTQLKCQADKFFDIWVHNIFLVSKMSPLNFPKIELNEGVCCDRVGSDLIWNYAIGECGEKASVTTRIEEIDKEKRYVKYSCHDGLMMKEYYKSLMSKIEATPNCEGQGCIVKWSFEYEKLNENAPEPDIYILIFCLALQGMSMLVFPHACACSIIMHELKHGLSSC
ncbi:hypothetical protein SOVF_050850 [Spinacia oleracea]|nr:hypothetical protein SOVF_050850 [Spinacia oleracea]